MEGEFGVNIDFNNFSFFSLFDLIGGFHLIYALICDPGNVGDLQLNKIKIKDFINICPPLFP